MEEHCSCSDFILPTMTNWRYPIMNEDTKRSDHTAVGRASRPAYRPVRPDVDVWHVVDAAGACCAPRTKQPDATHPRGAGGWTSTTRLRTQCPAELESRNPQPDATRPRGAGGWTGTTRLRTQCNAQLEELESRNPLDALHWMATGPLPFRFVNYRQGIPNTEKLW